jgi:precorrin-6Y C5,15-methyltransferase (decarboxylating)
LANDNKIHIIGVGDDGAEGVTAAARALIDKAQLLVGAANTLALFPAAPGERIEAGAQLDAVVQRIRQAGDARVVVLVSGDPLFFGLARYLCDKLGKDRFEVIPNVSSMQLAFARVKESWDEAYLTNVATQPLEAVVERLRTIEKAGLFTSDDVPPARIAQALLDRRIDYFSAYVCENLGSPDERVTFGDLADVASQDFSPLNVMILVRKPGAPDRPVEMIGHRLFGNADEMFLQSKPKRGLLTSMEVRTLALAELDLGPTSVVWDIGAGSGSVAIEAAQIASGGKVFAIEMDPDDHRLISDNAARFGVKSLVPVLGQAPAAWEKLPDPDAIFVGGTGRGIARMCELAFARLKPGGRLVANFNSIENLANVHETLRRLAGDVQLRMIHISHGTTQMESVRFEARNPTFLASVVKGK